MVLLNGKRITQFGGQAITGFGAAVDLNTIPLAAIERVEILTDGASALYGSDAVAGVVNFITRRNASDGDVSVGFSSPSGGARETRISATKGFGDIDTDGFNVLIAASADKRTKLKSTQRDFAKSALVKFADNGKNYQINSGSPSPIPANIVIPNGLAPLTTRSSARTSSRTASARRTRSALAPARVTTTTSRNSRSTLSRSAATSTFRVR
ncbi:hypothetical protein FSC37_09990 [Piscinibacter aquaticus]|uniref:TonB-dependent receptor plug domain-containing protein n=1 Tax=Piscinibacter aquaticus TaxID=392597 RepID=A0A5C6U3R1_9BURK|nr:hypothetical protein FSC37_09990 [Piscinibacter aquaticus]